MLDDNKQLKDLTIKLIYFAKESGLGEYQLAVTAAAVATARAQGLSLEILQETVAVLWAAMEDAPLIPIDN